MRPSYRPWGGGNGECPRKMGHSSVKAELSGALEELKKSSKQFLSLIPVVSFEGCSQGPQVASSRDRKR